MTTLGDYRSGERFLGAKGPRSVRVVGLMPLYAPVPGQAWARPKNGCAETRVIVAFVHLLQSSATFSVRKRRPLPNDPPFHSREALWGSLGEGPNRTSLTHHRAAFAASIGSRARGQASAYWAFLPLPGKCQFSANLRVHPGPPKSCSMVAAVASTKAQPFGTPRFVRSCPSQSTSSLNL